MAPAGGTLDHVGIVLSAGTNETITVSGITINGDDAGSIETGEGPALPDFAMSSSTDLSGAPFTLKGNINMSWPNGASGSDISAEIVGADKVVANPEPGTVALLGAALAGLGLLRRKRIV